ncbi:MAG: tRNA lysidine(34) synthetase TilS [Bacteroidales bacterium]|nr:tRNA lysidine(34) synthetase TilS [Candidatus Cacconaster caballi]
MQEKFDEMLDRLTANRSEKCRVLVAVSGGIDSMTMATLFLKSSLGIPFSVAHVNFNLRPGDCDEDQRLVRSWCGRNGVEFFTTSYDTSAYAKDSSISTQMAARDLRYGWFASLVKEKGFEYLAIAHNLNDSVETFFLNLLRGTGLRGLAGIKVSNGCIIRPLMGFTREEIERFAVASQVEYREDYTNRESHYSRNRLRNEVFPHLKMINSSFLSTIKGEMKRFSQIGEIMDELYLQKEPSLLKRSGDMFSIDIEALRGERHRSYWLFRMLEGCGFNESQLSQIEASVDAQSGKVFNSPTHTLVRDRNCLKVYPASEPPQLPGLVVRKMALPAGFNPKNAPQGVQYVDAAKIRGTLSIRRPKAGDRFKPFGMKGFKLLSDYFIDLKLDVEQKKQEAVIVLTDGKGSERIVAVAGRRIDDDFKITSKTTAILVCEVTSRQ